MQYTIVRAEFLRSRYIHLFSEISLRIYNSKNPPLYKCRNCNKIFYILKQYIKHAVTPH